MWRAVVVLLLVAGPTRADELDRFLDEYGPHWDRITAHLWRNVKASGTVKYHGAPDDPNGWSRIVRFSVVANDSTLVRRLEVTPADGPTWPESAVVVTPDQAVYLEQGFEPTRRRVARLAVPWDADRYQARGYFEAPAGDYLPCLPVLAVYIGRGPNAYHAPWLNEIRTALNFSRVRYAGEDVVEVRMPVGVLPGPLHVTPYRTVRLRATDWLLTSVEEPDPRFLSDGRWVTNGSRRVCDISYGPAAADELPFPTAARCRFVARDGTETTEAEVVFTEYRRHTPTVDELDAGKLFGATMPDPGPRPPLPPRGTYLPASDLVERVADRPPRGPRAQRMSTQERYIRAAGLGAFMLVAAVVAVWWRL